MGFSKWDLLLRRRNLLALGVAAALDSWGGKVSPNVEELHPPAGICRSQFRIVAEGIYDGADEGGVAGAAFEAVERRREQLAPNRGAQPIELDLDDQLVLEVRQRSRDAAAVADANGDRAGALGLCFGAAVDDTSFRNVEQRGESN